MRDIIISTYELPDSTKKMFDITIKHSIGIHQIAGLLKLKSRRYQVLQWDKATILRYLEEETYLYGNSRILKASEGAEDKYYELAYMEFPGLRSD